MCELLAPWLAGKVTFTGDEGTTRYEIGNGGYVRPTTGGVTIGKHDQLWLAQFIHLDGSTFVHICRSKAEAYQALVDQEGLEIGEGETAEAVIDDRFGDSINL